MLSVTALFAGSTLVHAEPSAVRIRVEQANKTDTEKFKKTQKRSLKIQVSNSGKEALELTVKYVFFGRDLSSKDIVGIDKGDLPASVGPGLTVAVETPTVTASGIEAHSEKAKKIEASGQKMMGHGVQVFQGETLVAENYEPLSMKEEFGKVTIVKPAAKK